MKFKNIIASVLALTLLIGSLVSPITASAQSGSDASKHRQKTKNNWRNLTYGAGAVTAYGLLRHNTAISVAGAAGTLYSLNRYEQDRRSQSKIDHQRYSRYSRSSYSQNGHTYHRHLVTRHGKKYYTFTRG